jgi:hypothetical protein
MEISKLEDDKFRNKMLNDDTMGMTFMSGVGDERSRIFDKLRKLDSLDNFKNGEELINGYLLQKPGRSKKS